MLIQLESTHTDSFMFNRPAKTAPPPRYEFSRPIAHRSEREPGIDIAPAQAVARRSLVLRGMTAEFVTLSRRERLTFSYRGPRHLLIVHEQGVRFEGETALEGLPRSSLRELRQKLTFVPAGHAYSEWQDPKVLSRTSYFFFDPAAMPALPAINGGTVDLSPRLFFANATLWEAASKLAAIGEADDPASRSYCEALGIVLAHEIVRLSAAPEANRVLARGGLAGWQKRAVTAYVDEHLGEPIPLAKLAALARLSPHYFCRAFKQSFGVPPHRYHIVRRIERAKALLAERTKSVTEIGLMLGFSETSSFTAAFRRISGQSPTAYRRDYT